MSKEYESDNIELNTYDETRDMNFNEKLDYYAEKKDYAAIVGLMFEASIKNRKGDDKDMAIIQQFINEKSMPRISFDDSPGALKNELYEDDFIFLKNLEIELAKRGRDIIMNTARKMDEYEEKIVKGEIKDTELVRDDPKLVSKIAHDIVIVRDGDDINAIFNISGMIKSKVQNLTFNGQNALKQIQEAETAQLEEYLKENNIFKDDYTECADRALDLNTKENYIYFKVKDGDVREGESLFESIPDNVEKYQKINDEEKLDQLEIENEVALDRQERFTESVKTAIEEARQMLEALKKTNRKHNSDSYLDLVDALENFCKLGKDYEYHIPGTDSVTKTSGIDRFTVGDALEQLSDAAENYEMEHSGFANFYRSNFGYGAERLKISRKLKDFTEFYKENVIPLWQRKDDIKNAKDGIEFGKKRKQQLGFNVIPETDHKNLTKEEDKFYNKLNANLLQSREMNEDYRTLFDNIAIYKKLSKKLQDSVATGNIDLEIEATQKLLQHSLRFRDSIDKCMLNENPDSEKSPEKKEAMQKRQDILGRYFTKLDARMDKMDAQLDYLNQKKVDDLHKSIIAEENKVTLDNIKQNLTEKQNVGNEVEKYSAFNALKAYENLEYFNKKPKARKQGLTLTSLAVIAVEASISEAKEKGDMNSIPKSKDEYKAMVQNIRNSGPFVNSVEDLMTTKGIADFLGDKNGAKKMLDNYRAEEKEVKRMLDNANKKNANKEANAGMKGKINTTGMKK